jgi:hypothetical protein
MLNATFGAMQRRKDQLPEFRFSPFFIYPYAKQVSNACPLCMMETTPSTAFK